MTAPRSNASHDQNFETTLMGVSTVDGTTPVPAEVDPVTGQLQVGPSGTAQATGGYTPGKLISAASNNATVIKASAGTLGYLTAGNVNAAARYVKLYDKATTPVVGTDVPIHTFIIPGNTAGAGTNIPLPTQGIKCTTGISIALTVEATDAGSTIVAASEITLNWGSA
jgi:hypothetical protein